MAYSYADQAKHRQGKRAWVRALMGCCTDCGNEDARVLEWDHIVPVLRKRRSWSTGTPIALASAGASWKRIWAAIFACEVRCANCHMIRHTEDRRRAIA